MRVGVVVFSRMGSQRLPGKALWPIGARPLVGRVLDRARRVRLGDRVVLATSTDPRDDALASFAQSEGVDCYRGSPENVTERAARCAAEFGWTVFARICGDRAFFDPGHVDLAIAQMVEAPAGSVDLVSNIVAGPVAPGLTTEVVRRAALEEVLRQTSDAGDLEHVTRYLYAHPEKFRLVGLNVPLRGTENLRFAVDTFEDLQRAQFIASRLADPAAAPLAHVADLAREWELRRRREDDWTQRAGEVTV